MHLNTSTANKLSPLCLRVSKAEEKAQKQFQLEPVNRPKGLKNNPYDKINLLCCRIKKLEKDVGIPSNETNSSHKSVKLDGNAFISNKVNQLCYRVAHIERILSSNV
jgi:hypothetical protein